MLCIKCGATLQDPEYCSACGTDIKIYGRLIRLSNTYYNMGLEKAKVRNLSGAIQDLKTSLKLNKEHIPARNLLGLIYFETGEVVSALTEWIISKNLESNKNIADEYIRAIQNNPARLETINQTIKKYNQSLLYCQQGSDDLAVIQLKKVLSLNPKLVKAHQLLALLYIQAEEYDRAGRELRRALAIDKTDNLSLRYLEELEQRTGTSVNNGNKPEREGKDRGKAPDVISYTSGNETIIMPSTYKDNAGVNVVLNLLIGLVVGVALMWFLVVPAKIRSVRSETNQQIVEYGDQISAKQAEINSLQKQLEDLQSEQTVEEEKPDTSVNYVKLLEAYEAVQAEDSETALAALDEVDPEQLSPQAQTIYNEIYGPLHIEEVKSLFDAGSAAYNAGNHDEVITNMEQVIAVEEDYEDGYAMYYLARSYEAKGDTAKALPLFQKFVEKHPATARARYSNEAIARIQQTQQ
ncbi:tetratricopeptide repeat protein [Candidatus Merdisoma sp. JLR.KK006]|uniref:tetratricopeptide repeat protein n=1 Tax=Candidatus Merdisoma sp. JLR.KK006 TaxID=3112626 RepID=UPI002FF0600B